MNLRAILITANALVLIVAFGGAASLFFGLGWIGDPALADLATRAGLLIAVACLHLLAVLLMMRSGRGKGELIAALLIASPLTLALLKGWLP